MSTNLLIALKNLSETPVQDLKNFYTGANRMNNMGEALEQYVKDAFCNTFGEGDATRKNEIFQKNFSYIGNQNNPPDMVIKGGDAIEVKKIESKAAGIALNSSYPKDKLYVDSPMITEACRTCEEWSEKDILYVVGSVINNKLVSLWFVYGDCYAANKEIYERIKNIISGSLQSQTDLELADTKELGRVNRVDPLGITLLRIRGMWHIENPNAVFRYVLPTEMTTTDELSVQAIVLTGKYDSFPASDRRELENSCCVVSDIKIKSPNNPVNLLDAKLISFVGRQS